jgi:hypothetical protein
LIDRKSQLQEAGFEKLCSLFVVLLECVNNGGKVGTVIVLVEVDGGESDVVTLSAGDLS